MKFFVIIIISLLTFLTYAKDQSIYKVKEGQLHTKGKIIVSILPDPKHFKVQMDYEIKKKPLVPVPDKLLRGKTVMEFPDKFRTEEGYKELERKKTMEIPKAILKFAKKAKYGKLENAYFVDVFPKNKKTSINLVYHPSLPSVGWSEVKIKFISKIPVLDGYRVEAVLKN